MTTKHFSKDELAAVRRPEAAPIPKSIRCGNCKATHGSVQEVKACYGNPQGPAQFFPLGTEQEMIAQAKAKAQPTGNTATEKQVAFIGKLFAERSDVEAAVLVEAAWHDLVEAGKAGKKEASATIECLLMIPKPKAQGGTEPRVDLADGVYAKDDQFILVYHTVHGANQQVTKFLTITEAGNGTFEGEWNYAGKRGLKGLLPEHKLDEEAARKFGQTYGICVRCARTLTRDESKHVGYGPTCAGHEGWWYPTKAELKALTAEAKAAS